MNHLSILLNNPTLIDAGINLVKTTEATLLKSIQKVWKKTGSLPSKESVLSLIKDEKLKASFEEAYTLSESDVELFKSDIIENQKLLFRSYLVEASLNDSLDVDPQSLKKQWDKIVSFKETEIENEYQVSTVNDMFNIIKDIQLDDEEAKIPTGYTQLDDIVGGWKDGSTYCVMGLSGVGKSIFLANFASKLWYKNGSDILYISTEMNHKQTYDRILRSSLDATKSTISDELLKLKQLGQTSWGKIKVVKIHPNDQTCEDIQNIINNLDWKPRAIIIDYFDEIRASDKTVSEYEKHGVVASDMKKLAEVNQCPVLTATQTNRGGASDKGSGTKEFMGQGDISDSHKKVRTLDVLFGIIQTASMLSDDGTGEYQLQTIKNRYGKTGVLSYFNINYHTMRITENLLTNKTPKKISKSNIDHKDKLDKYYENLKTLSNKQEIKEELKDLLRKHEIDMSEMESLAHRIAEYKEVS